MKTTLHPIWWAPLLALLFFAGCAKDKEPKPLPSLEAVRPESAAVGATVTLVGSDFSVDPSKNTVTFSGVTGTVEQATETELVVRVPVGAYLPERPYAEVLVATEGRNSSWPVILKSDFYPDVFSITPQVVRAGEVITINGQNLSLDLTQTMLLFQGNGSQAFRAFPTASTGTTLRVQVPAGAVSSDVDVFMYTNASRSTYISRSLPITILP